MIWSKFSHFVDYAFELTLLAVGVFAVIHSMWRTTTREFVWQAFRGGVLIMLACISLWWRRS